MRAETVSERLKSGLLALIDHDTSPLLGLLAEDVTWLVDWKGEGVFEGGWLHGRHTLAGRAKVRDFLCELFRHQQFRSIEFTRQLIDEPAAEVILMGCIEWARPTGGPYSSDFTVRAVLAGDSIERVRFLTLPQNHLDTFITDHRHSPELDIEHYHQVVHDFTKLYFDAYLLGKTWGETYWKGIPIFKCPLDLWIYQETIYEQRPDLIVETGTCAGGSALYLADLCELVGNGRVVTIDTVRHKAGQPQHDRLTYLVASSTAPETLDQIRGMIPNGGTVMTVFDSDHRAPHVLNELRLYSDLVTVGNYMIVEDSGLNGHPIKAGYGPGPMEAIDQFLSEDGRFRVDAEKEKFLMTSNPRGYLRKLRE